MLASKDDLGSIYTEQLNCRICGSRALRPFLDLGEMPLVNRYLSARELGEPELRFPLKLLVCGSCWLSQLSVVVRPEILYSNYHYYSSVSKTFQAHCQRLELSLRDYLQLSPGELVVEIASNDGCLLSFFKNAGFRSVGVEPAANLARITSEMGISTYREFWSKELASRIETEFGKPRLIIGTNVLAHVNDLHGFIDAAASILHPSGAFVFEVPYMEDFLFRYEFDTAYHEHLSYFILHPLVKVLGAHGLRVVHVERFEIHGGSIRVIACPAAGLARDESPSVKRLLDSERQLGLLGESVYVQMARQVESLRANLCGFLLSLKRKQKKLAGYGASAKGNILLNYCDIGTKYLDYVVDDTPAKQGKYYPGVHIPIVSREALRASMPDYLLLLAWNFMNELIENTSEFSKNGGHYIVPVPRLKVI
jgi:C-methyltransferase C-terminal domain/Putative zinc binding domain/Methyltransferase domain